MYDTTFIRYPHTTRIDTIQHERTIEYDKQGNYKRTKVSEFIFNSELAVVLDFDADKGLLRRLYETNRDSLKKDTYVMKFKRDYLYEGFRS